MRGCFIVVEGTDRCGKTTQVRLLQEELRSRGIDVRVMRFPDRSTAVGGVINDFLSNTRDLAPQAVHLLFSANRWERAAEMEEALSQGTWLICDRYWYSGVAYSVAALGLDRDWCCTPDEGLPQPDLVIQLEVSPAVAEARGGYGEERYEKRAVQLRVAEEMRAFQKEVATWTVVSADQVGHIVFDDTDRGQGCRRHSPVSGLAAHWTGAR